MSDPQDTTPPLAGTTDINGFTDPRLLETIDKLFELNVGDSVALPQLLVVGDQSSGKSSVLEGLTNLPFPRDSGLCTRYATQIIFNRKEAARISISIIPAENAAVDQAEKMRGWKKADLESLSPETFARLLTEVHDLMNIGEGKRTFSDDVLKIEICGPEQDHLSVVDFPGIFRNITEGITTEKDMSLVRNMVTTYMRNPRSVILAVIPANVDVATQEILKMAADCDKRGQRTLGVLTKPDLVDKGAEHAVIDLLEGRAHKLNLGWHIVRNPGQQQLIDSSTERHANERTFFKTESPWSRLTEDKVGIQALHTRLKDVLTEIVRREFSNVKVDINKRLQDCERQLIALGPSRESQEGQHRYLLSIATQFRETTSLALKAQYGDASIFEQSPSLKLATAVVTRNAVFSDEIYRLGHTMEFVGESHYSSNANVGEASLSKSNLEDSEAFNLEECITDYPELQTVLDLDVEVGRPSKTGILAWIEREHRRSRGFALGTFDFSLLKIIWKHQSKNWDKLTRGYINDIICLVHAFTMKLLSSLCSDQWVRRGLTSVLVDQLLKRYQEAINHTAFILQVERDGNPLTVNHYFSENLEKSRLKKFRDQLQPHAFNVKGYTQVIKLDTIDHASRASNLEHTVQQIHDVLHSYYKVARKRFVDVVCMQAADYYLVNGAESSVRLFSPEFVYGLTPEQLGTIAGESAATRMKREELKREITKLEEGKKVLI